MSKAQKAIGLVAALMAVGAALIVPIGMYAQGVTSHGISPNADPQAPKANGMAGQWSTTVEAPEPGPSGHPFRRSPFFQDPYSSKAEKGISPTPWNKTMRTLKTAIPPMKARTRPLYKNSSGISKRNYEILQKRQAGPKTTRGSLHWSQAAKKSSTNFGPNRSRPFPPWSGFAMPQTRRPRSATSLKSAKPELMTTEKPSMPSMQNLSTTSKSGQDTNLNSSSSTKSRT